MEVVDTRECPEIEVDTSIGGARMVSVPSTTNSFILSLC
ncbi:hypothetical protein DEALK_08910 [Dehalogenimonas alkenigignens]|uniref:Uncharacterized protein n=1 Tax=Dehalogenimonas alkenigignens TaxID=1217799 RepID=A0A0W0GHM6_9CHLR|nr:hypothetical protein DEALK_08910 [Dehalogenimonas alkenigignens]